MAREWTERHIRELVRQEMKRFKSGSDFPYVHPAYYDASISINGYDLSSYIPQIFEQTDYLPVSDVVEEGNRDDSDYYTFRYVIQPSVKLYWNGDPIFAILPFDSGLHPYEIPLKKGSEPEPPTDLARSYEGGSGGELWINLFAYQDGKYYGLESLNRQKVSHGTNSGNEYVISTIFVASDRLQEVDEFKQSFSPWSEYRWDEKSHYLCYNLGYLKERS